MLVLLAGTIAFSASKMLYGDKALGKIIVGVVVPENDRLSEMAMNMVASLDSVGSLCEFTYTDKEEGTKLLERGEIFALMELPPGLLEGIIDGSNIPVTITFPENSGLEAAVFKELTQAGTSILGTAQAAIYSTDDYLIGHQMQSSIRQAEKDLNTVFMRYALSREAYFRTEKVSASGDVTTAVFYGISAVVMILLLLGIPAAPIVRPYKIVVEQKLALCGIGRVKRTAVRTAALTRCCFWLPLFRLPVLSVKVILTVRLLRWQAGCLYAWRLQAGFCLSTSFAAIRRRQSCFYLFPR